MKEHFDADAQVNMFRATVPLCCRKKVCASRRVFFLSYITAYFIPIPATALVMKKYKHSEKFSGVYESNSLNVMQISHYTCIYFNVNQFPFCGIFFVRKFSNRERFSPS